MSYYLLENHMNLHNGGKLPWYTTRRTCKHGIQGAHLAVVHTPETLEDFSPPDSAAENVAQYGARTTRASWHFTSDSDSAIQMLPWTYTAWHVMGYNRCAIGGEIGAKATSWPGAPDWWEDAVLDQAAVKFREGMDFHGIPYRKITRAQADRGEYGMIGHGELDPDRRSDPGSAFDWDQLIALVKGDTMALPKEVEKFVMDMYNTVEDRGSNGTFAGLAVDLIRATRDKPLHKHTGGSDVAPHRHRINALTGLAEEVN